MGEIFNTYETNIGKEKIEIHLEKRPHVLELNLKYEVFLLGTNLGTNFI